MSEREAEAIAEEPYFEEVDPELPEPVELSGPETAGLDTLLQLERRGARLLVVSPPGDDRDRIVRLLETAGYWRLECASELFEAHARCKAAGEAPFRMLLVDLEPNRAEGLEPMGAVRHLEPLLRSFGPIPAVFVTQLPDPILELLARNDFGALAQDATPEGCAKLLDDLLAKNRIL